MEEGTAHMGTVGHDCSLLDVEQEPNIRDFQSWALKGEDSTYILPGDFCCAPGFASLARGVPLAAPFGSDVDCAGGGDIGEPAAPLNRPLLGVGIFLGRFSGGSGAISGRLVPARPPCVVCAVLGSSSESSESSESPESSQELYTKKGFPLVPVMESGSSLRGGLELWGLLRGGVLPELNFEWSRTLAERRISA